MEFLQAFMHAATALNDYPGPLPTIVMVLGVASAAAAALIVGQYEQWLMRRQKAAGISTEEYAQGLERRKMPYIAIVLASAYLAMISQTWPL
jgi:hypothetical protein